MRLGAQGGNRESMSAGIKGKSNVRTRKGENVCHVSVCGCVGGCVFVCVCRGDTELEREMKS